MLELTIKKMKNTVIITLLILAGLFGCTPPTATLLPPENLKCEYRVNPLGIDAVQPRLFWEIPDNPRGTMQGAYQVMVATSDSLLSKDKADIWNSGKIKSNQNIQVVYNGSPLESGKRYYWKVRFWDQHGNLSHFSRPSWWETGLMKPGDWKGTWVNNGTSAPESEADMYKDIPNPLFRKGFALDKKIASARLYISGLGYYEAYINGKRVGDHVLDPGWTNYSKTIQYVTYDITGLLNTGKNAIGVMLGNGWFNPLPLYLFNRLNLRKVLTIGQPEFIAQLAVTYEDGSTSVIASDNTWKTGKGPILMNNVYLGERYDARLEQDGWDAPGFDDSGWTPAVKATSPGGALTAMIQPPVRITNIVAPVKITEPKKGVYIFDMGQNFAGVARLNVHGPAGTRVQLRYGELLYDDGTLNDRSTIACHIWDGSYVKHRPGAPLNANQTDTYILKGKGEEIYKSSFTFHGFRYVEVTGYPGKPDLESVMGLRMNSDLKPVGSFSCSNPLFNKIQENTEWTMLSNVFSVESDCPGREKFGYGGDMVSASEAFMMNYDMADFYTKAIHDFANDQKPSGGMTECAPNNDIEDQGLTKDTGPIGWMLAFPWLQKRLYTYYGDRQLIEKEYDATKNLVEFIHTHAPDNLVKTGISDHESLVTKPFMVSGTAFYYDHVKTLAEFATLLGKTQDAETYKKLARDIKQAFIDKLVNKTTGAVDSATQASQAIALYYGLLPDNIENPALKLLTENISVENNDHLTTGIFGTKMMFEVLRKNNLDNLGYAVNNQRTFPSYGYMIDNGATTIWESWKGYGSHNHPMFGSVSEWFYKGVGGISPADDAVGFNDIVIKPFFTDSLQWMKTTYHSIRGLIETSWFRLPGEITFNVIIPGNTNAIVYFPAEDPENITERGIPIKQMKEAEYVNSGNGSSVFKLGSGHYSFRIKK